MLGKERFSGNDGPDTADTWWFSHRHSVFQLYGATLQRSVSSGEAGTPFGPES